MSRFGIDLPRIRELSKQSLSDLLRKNNGSNNGSDSMSLRFAACCVAAKSALGLTAFDEQLVAAVALYSKKVVEMKTGEGKTLSAVFAAFLFKCDNRKVHIFTFNDYLAKRDYNWMKPVYELLGVETALITEKTPFDERKAAYNNADVIYSTVKECGFDFLRDFMVFERENAVGRICGNTEDDTESGTEADTIRFDVAIFDEADSVLIDEARIPLVIAGDVDATVSDEFVRVFDFAKTLTVSDYKINLETMSVFLTDDGALKTEEYFKTDNLYDVDNIDLRCNLETCMKALFFLKENKDYVVKDGRIKLIDALTGRIAQHRLLPGALQAATETKHGLKVTERGVVTGIIPIQFFARQYKDIAGMTGTAKPSAEEFELLYGLEVEIVKPHNPSARIDHPSVVYSNSEEKRNAVTDEVLRLHRKRQPVLVGTSSIEESETLAKSIEARLNEEYGESRENGKHSVSVLNAKNDEMEADIIKNAGQAGAITVSTNMAGRGIDIKLGGFDEETRDEVVKAGGLCIIGTTLYENARMNEQLNGRSGRQGDIGETRLFISIQDEIMLKYELKKLSGRHYKKIKPGIVTNKTVLREIDRIQRIAQGDLLEERKRLLRFTMIGEKHRDVIFKKRLEYLVADVTESGGTNSSLSIWKEYSAVQYKKAVEKFGEYPLQKLERQVILSAINEVWCDYLEYTSELRTGIHLRAVAGRNPAEEYNIDSEHYFEGAQERLINKVTDALERILESENVEDYYENLFRPKNARTFLLEESGDELVRKPILLNVFFEDESEA